ncbi:MAG: hypothetical protein FWB99_02660 [Treponema sp.]|nr:hypothetical protein [Treponema sp.]
MNRNLLLGILVMAVIGLTMTACDGGGSGGGSGNGTIRVRITEIPASLMQDGHFGLLMFGLGRANQLSTDPATWLAGRDTNMFGDDRTNWQGETSGSFWYEFTFYNLHNNQHVEPDP